MKRTITGVLLMSSLLVACNSPEKKRTADAIRVQTETVSETNVNHINNTYVGEVEAQTSTAVSFAGSGTIQKMYVNEGQYVCRGQLIAQLDETVPRNSLQSSQANMKQAQDAYDRMQRLYNSQSISEMDWVQVQTNLEKAKSDLQNKQKSLNDCRLLAPCSGVIGSKNMESGMNAMSGQAVCNILDISRVKVKISVPEREIMNIAHDATIKVEALGGKEFKSIDMERGVTADAISRTYEVRYLVENTDKNLLPGMVCTVSPQPSHRSAPLPLEGEVPAGRKGSSITVPITSVQKSADGTIFVWTVSHGNAHRTPVSTGKAHGNRIVILGGIKESDSVVIKGYQKLNENSKVKE